MKKYLFLLTAGISSLCYGGNLSHVVTNDTPPVVGLGTEETSHSTSTEPDENRLKDTLTSFHGGTYALGFLGFGYHTSKLNDQTYKDRSAQFGGIMGFGKVEGGKYVGMEAIYAHDRFNKHKGKTRFRRTAAYEIAGRLGKIIRANFMPYARLGVGVQDYIYNTDTSCTHFKGTLLTPGVGVQAFFRKNMLLRVETNYQWTLKTSKKIKVNQKPSGPSIWGGVGMVF